LASLIVNRTHSTCGSGMEVPSAAISPLGLVLDLIWHKVFTRMRRRSAARSGGARTCLAGASGWTNGRRSKAIARSLWRTRERESDGGRRRGMGSTPPWAILFIGGSTESIRSGSFHHTKRLNGSIPGSSQKIKAGVL
jgi:hypothetical protein